jgi:tight adherence protein C
MQLPDPTLLITLLAGLAVFCAILAAAWPFMVRDTLAQRMAEVTQQRERIRVRERTHLNSGKKQVLLRMEPRRLFAAIVERLKLTRRGDDSDMVRMLRRAGFRGAAPDVTYLALRLLLPILTICLTAFYVFVVIQPDLPLLARLAIVIGGGGLGFVMPRLYVKNRIAKRQTSIRRSWPDALDLLLICVESGMSSEMAFRKVSEEIGSQSVELAEELSLTTAELSFLPDRRTAYENLALRTDLDGVRAVVSGLTQSEKYGTSLGHALRVLAQESRDTRMSEAEKLAASLPPKLTVPMILFFMPVLFAVIITPAVIQIMSR